ncbi:hypothetical protein L2E82_35054 [Cichorium intybus]|uniref:Uncharacterized protein n=1 Tax=Cichorium intybus TaxID=13427 RepID=A0ACB9BN76_CICIN|nr:hypothetical protein L2E82_35054 [Cichorium intybus]
MSNNVFLKNSIWLNKNPVIPGCTFFLSFGLAAARLDSPTPLKVGLTHHPQEVLNSPDFGKVKKNLCKLGPDDDDDDINGRNTCSLRSNLKRPTRTISVSVAVDNESGREQNSNTVGRTLNLKMGMKEFLLAAADLTEELFRNLVACPFQEAFALTTMSMQHA